MLALGWPVPAEHCVTVSQPCLCHSTAAMDKDEAQPDSQPPEPLPSPERAQAWSGEQEEAESGSGGPRTGRRGALQGQRLFVSFEIEDDPELSRGEGNEGQQETPEEGCAEPQLLESELSQGDQESSLPEAEPSPLVSDWEECREPALSVGDIEKFQEISDWEESVERPLSPGEGTSQRGLPERNASSKQELSQGKARRQEVSEGQGQRRPSKQSSWEDDGDQEQSPHSRESRKLKAKLREDDDWDKISILSLPEKDEEAKRQKLAVLAQDRLQASWKARVKCPAPGPCCLEQLPARPRPVAARAPVGHAWGSPGQGVPRRKRRRLFRRALRALQRLFRCPCLAARPQR